MNIDPRLMRLLPLDIREVFAFGDFIRTHQCTADQLYKAYCLMCGVSDDDGSHTKNDQTVMTLLEEMTSLHLPLNYFVKFIAAKIENERSAIQEFRGYVDALSITGKEKTMLKSIVGNMRCGEVECFADDREFAHFMIEKSISREGLARSLVSALREIVGKIPKGMKYEFTFSEFG